MNTKPDLNKAFAPSLKASQAFLKRYGLSDLLPYLAFDEQRELFINKNSCGFILETVPLMGSSEQIERQLTGLFQHTLPEGSHIQFLLLASARIEPWLTRWKLPRFEHPLPIYKTLAEKRVQFFEQKTKSIGNVPFCIRHFKVIISYSVSGVNHGDVALDELMRLREQFMTAVKGLNLPVKNWNAEDLLCGLDELLNLNERLDYPNLQWNPYQALSEQLLSPATHFLVDKDALYQADGQQSIRLYQTRGLPLHWCLSEMGRFIGDPMNRLLQLPMPFALHYGVHICEEKTLKMRLLAKCSAVENQANSPLAKWIPSLQRQADEWQYVRKQFEQGQRLVKTQFQVLLFGETKRINNAEQQLLNIFRANSWELTRETLTILPSFISCLPMSWGEGAYQDQALLQKLKTTLSHEPTNLLPIQGEWQGTPSPGMLLTGRRGQLFFWDPFDNEAGNYNLCVVGKSGSGKSVFMQELMTASLGRQGRIFVLDVGRSFERTARLLGGTIIEFSTHSPVCINPFSTIPLDDKEAITDALAMLKPVVALMAAPLMGTNDLENALIEKAIRSSWDKKGREASIQDIADYLLADANPKAQSLGQMLYPYTAAGSFGRFFCGKANIDLKASLVILELEELKERKDLQSVIIQMVILQITNQVYLGDRKTPTQIILDEAWDMLRAKQAGEFMETAARRLRKYRAGLVAGTQTVDDLYATPGSRAVFDNSDWLALLSLKKESIAQLKSSSRLSLEPYMESLLKTVHTVQGEYAEMMIMGPEGYAIGRLWLDPFSSALYTTKAAEFTAIKHKESQGLSLIEAIEELVIEKEKYQ
jgi:conjugal transfer ATP-binding protein TraC